MNNIVNVQIVHENKNNDFVTVRYEDTNKKCCFFSDLKYYHTKKGRYVNINGERYYINNNYRYSINKKGEDIDFSKLVVDDFDIDIDSYFNYCLVLKPISKITYEDFKSLMCKNNKQKLMDIINENNLWEDEIDFVYYNIFTEKIFSTDCSSLQIDEYKEVSESDKKIFKELIEIYSKDNEYLKQVLEDEEKHCKNSCPFNNPFGLDPDEYRAWQISVGDI